MPRRRKTLVPKAPLTSVPAALRDQFVRQGRFQPKRSRRLSGGSRKR
jgi:hypothetical protein